MYQESSQAFAKAIKKLGHKVLNTNAFNDHVKVNIAHAFYNLSLNPEMIMCCLKVDPDKKVSFRLYNAEMLLDTMIEYQNKELTLINQIYTDNAETLEQFIYEYVKAVYAVQDRYDNSQENPVNTKLTLDTFLEMFNDYNPCHDFFNLRFRPLPVLLDKERNSKGVVVSDKQFVLCLKEASDGSLEFKILDTYYFATCNSSEVVYYPKQIQRGDYQSIVDEITKYINDVSEMVKNYCKSEGLLYCCDNDEPEEDTEQYWRKLVNTELIESYARGLVELSENTVSEVEVLLLNNAIKNLKAYIALQ